MDYSRASPATLAYVFLLLSASAQQVSCAPSLTRLPVQAQLPGEWIPSAALPGTPVCKFYSLSKYLPRGMQGGMRETPLTVGFFIDMKLLGRFDHLLIRSVHPNTCKRATTRKGRWALHTAHRSHCGTSVCVLQSPLDLKPKS